MSVLTSITRIFNLYGSPMPILTAGASRTITGMIVPMDTATINIYFDGNESVGLVHPAFSLFVAGSQSSPPEPNDVFTYNDLGTGGSRLLEVRKIQCFRIANEIVLILALCD